MRKHNKHSHNKHCMVILGTSKRTLTCIKKLLKEWNVETTTIGSFNQHGKTVVRMLK